MKTINVPAVVFLTAAAYLAVFELNRLLFSSFDVATSVNLVYLPSGLRLAFVLIFGVWGAIGIILGSIAANLMHYFDGDAVTAVVAGIISGLAPLLARSVSVHFCALDTTLRKLNIKMLLKSAVMFAVLSSVLHQLWFTYRGYSDHFISTTAEMATGDFFGTILILYAVKYLTSGLRNGQRNLKDLE